MCVVIIVCDLVPMTWRESLVCDANWSLGMCKSGYNYICSRVLYFAVSMRAKSQLHTNIHGNHNSYVEQAVGILSQALASSIPMCHCYVCVCGVIRAQNCGLPMLHC